jgi:hypothetical protein
VTLELPDGVGVGSIVLVTWDPRAEVVEPGEFEGRIIKRAGGVITVRFLYPGNRIPEDIDIDLDSGRDLRYGQAVAAIDAKEPG